MKGARLVRSALVAGVACGVYLSACASGGSDLGLSGTGAAVDEDGSAPDAGGAVGPDAAGPTGPASAADSGGPDGSRPSIDSGAATADSGSASHEDAAPGDGALEDAAPDGPSSCGSPSGTYSSSCTSCAVAGTTLTCTCATGSGPSIQTSLDLCTCPVLTEISNSKGTLSCCGVPAGSYTSNCTDCTVVDSTLACTCQTNKGMSSLTTLNLCSCSDATQISNSNGQLTCP